MGMLASRFVLEWNHWIAFVLLIFLGGRMIIEGFRGADDEDEEPRRRHGFWLLVTTAIATSPMPWLWVLVLLSCRSTLSRPHWPLVVQP